MSRTCRALRRQLIIPASALWRRTLHQAHVRPALSCPEAWSVRNGDRTTPRAMSTVQGGDLKTRDSESEEGATRLNQRAPGGQEQEVRVGRCRGQRPWHRQGVDDPPARRPRPADSLTKGKLLTTPTRLLKLILPVPLELERQLERNDKCGYGRSIAPNDTIQPLALLVHPQQPLSYVERLIQAEIPPILEDGREKIPNVYFRAGDSDHGDSSPETRKEAQKKEEELPPRAKPARAASEPVSAHEAPERRRSEKSWVRWSNSTEVGDFIRDAAGGREFAIEIEGYNVELRVTVPSFNERTYYMRTQLRRMSRQIDELARIKRECDLIAYRGANFLAKGGFAVLSGWWATVYYVTFHTEYGWDLIEPVTYLAGLTTIMAGYLWFLYISRDLSYKAALNVTVSRRQNALYEARGFDQHRWEQLVQEANSLRREIKAVAVEYDVDWDEAKEVGEDVKEVLSEERTKARDRARSLEKERDEEFTDEEKRKEDPPSAEKDKPSDSRQDGSHSTSRV